MGQTVGGIAVAASTIYSYLCEDTELAHTDVEKKFREASRISAFGSLKNKLISTGKENFKEKKTRFLKITFLIGLSEPSTYYMYRQI
jgi:hypothetical protein